MPPSSACTGRPERLALDVPQGQVERAQGVLLFASRRIEEGARHILPQPLDVVRVLADQPAGALLQHVLGAAFADAGDPGLGLHGHHQVALVEQRIGVGRFVDTDSGDLGFGDRGENPPGNRAGRRGRRERTKERSALHESYSTTERVRPREAVRSDPLNER